MAHDHSKHAMGVGAGQHAGHVMTTGIAASAITAAGAHTGRGIMKSLTRHPLILLAIGVTAGYYAHKYRKEIIGYATKVSGMGKDFVLQQKENLEDLAAEAQEAEEEETGSAGKG